ncbi:heavy-metal-associated domain-containing protein [Piscinibacter terrae]|uniref:Copper chaperone n=1 Tax=Piscinibacter terrae TaxID=2496871 RepID=A0A3N7HIE9_9BURK|nr:heavy-metal-associated domain-containing protein [Albitalea terrae]RQP21814.1 copper chaperone [Albitalea terrae]
MEFKVDAMSCGHCVKAVTRAVQTVDPQAKVDVDLGSHTVRVETTRDEKAVAAALTEAGYPPSR